MLYHRIVFGKYAGQLISEILHDEKWIGWYCKKIKRRVHTTVIQAIDQNNFLAQ